MFQDTTFLQGSQKNPTKKEKRFDKFDKYLSSAKAVVRAQLVRYQRIQPQISSSYYNAKMGNTGPAVQNIICFSPSFLS